VAGIVNHLALRTRGRLAHTGGVTPDLKSERDLRRAGTPRRVVIVAFEAVQVLDVAGPAEVFALANRFSASGELYDVELVARRAGPVRASGGLELVAQKRFDEVADADTVIVAGGFGVAEAMGDHELIGWLRRLGRTARRVASVCSGAFVLAQSGLLDGRRATTHWEDAELLADAFPRVDVDADAIFVHDGHVWTSAGVTAGIDLCLALVEADHGQDLARRVAQQLVVFLVRPGGQAQFSSHLSLRLAERPSVRELQAWIADHLDADLTVAALAERAHMSVRHFSRAFHAEVGVTPGDYVEDVRLDAARQLLQRSRASTAEIARRCGFRTLETFHRVFKRRMGVTPGDYRRRFWNGRAAV
jgi:transcriptional regulator GlxA family with amidase domain